MSKKLTLTSKVDLLLDGKPFKLKRASIPEVLEFYRKEVLTSSEDVYSLFSEDLKRKLEVISAELRSPTLDGTNKPLLEEQFTTLYKMACDEVSSKEFNDVVQTVEEGAESFSLDCPYKGRVLSVIVSPEVKRSSKPHVFTNHTKTKGGA